MKEIVQDKIQGQVWVEVVSKGVHSYSRSAGACLSPKRGDATGGHKARR